MESIMNTNLAHEIGTHAGVVYRYLHSEPETTPAAIKRGTGLTQRQIDLALGWLAREAKLAAMTNGRTVRYSVI